MQGHNSSLYPVALESIITPRATLVYERRRWGQESNESFAPWCGMMTDPSPQSRQRKITGISLNIIRGLDLYCSQWLQQLHYEQSHRHQVRSDREGGENKSRGCQDKSHSMSIRSFSFVYRRRKHGWASSHRIFDAYSFFGPVPQAATSQRQ